MLSTSSSKTAPTILIIGASRGLGLAMAAEFLKKGWAVVGTVRGEARTQLHDLADRHAGLVDIEALDICEPDQLAALHARLSGRMFDILFVNAGTTNNPAETIAEVTTGEFVRVMITNALSPMRVVESLEPFVAAAGLIGVMSSGQGSVEQQRDRYARGLSRQQGGVEHVHAQLRRPPCRDATRDGADGAGLGPHRSGRTGRRA